MAQVNKSASTLVAVIGDEDTVTGFLLAGVGERNSKGEANFFIVDDRKQNSELGKSGILNLIPRY
jgi:V-type H+-transporting ATPase subunit F